MLSIDCMDCGKTVYGQDWLSGGMCASCGLKHDIRIEQLREEQRKSFVFVPSESCNCDDCKKQRKI